MRNLIIVGIVGVCLGVILASQLLPPKVVTKTEERTVTEVQEKVITKVVKAKDGTVTITKEATKVSEKVADKKVVRESSPDRVKAGAQNRVSAKFLPTGEFREAGYERRLWGPAWIGLHGTTRRELLLSIGVEF